MMFDFWTAFRANLSPVSVEITHLRRSPLSRSIHQNLNRSRQDPHPSNLGIAGKNCPYRLIDSVTEETGELRGDRYRAEVSGEDVRLELSPLRHRLHLDGDAS